MPPKKGGGKKIQQNVAKMGRHQWMLHLPVVFFFLGWPRVARGGLGWLRVAEPGGAILLPAALVVAACDELVLFIRLQT